MNIKGKGAMHKALYSLFVLLLLPLASLFTIFAQPTQVYAVESRDLTNAGHTFKKEWMKGAIDGAKKYKILPSLIFTQLFVESQWGDAGLTAKVDNNLSGMKYPGGGVPGIKVTHGTGVTEYGHSSTYAHYESVSDYMLDYTYLLRDGNNYKVAGKADFNEAVKGLFIEGGAKYNYAEVGYAHYKDMMVATRSAINSQNDNFLDTIDKEIVGSGEWDGSVSTEEENATETEKAVSNLKADDDFLVNGYGALTSKDWQEQISNAEEYVSNINPEQDLENDQKRNLQEWTDDYYNKNNNTVIKNTRLFFALLGYLALFWGMLMMFAYAFDRVGILEISALELVTFGRLRTAFPDEDSTFRGNGNTKGQPKAMTFKDMIIISIALVTLFVLIVTGKIYEYAWWIYDKAYQIIKFGNSLH